MHQVLGKDTIKKEIILHLSMQTLVSIPKISGRVAGTKVYFISQCGFQLSQWK